MLKNATENNFSNKCYALEAILYGPENVIAICY